MTKFLDGPAKAQTLALHRAPIFLRVVHDGQGWDALDQPTDSPRENEKIFAYKLHEHFGVAHINRGGGRGGFYPITEYKFINYQPDDAIMRNPELWARWCETQ